LYCHYDVQPVSDGWNTPAWQLTPKDGRWFGRGSADCKGNVIAHLTALRALGGGDFPIGVKLVAEGSEEQGTGGLEDFVPQNAELLAADAILVCDTGNFQLGTPTLTTSLRGVVIVELVVRTLEGPMHSGMYGGGAPDALQALIWMVASLRDEHGDTTVRGLDNTQSWSGIAYPAARFRTDARVLDGVDLVGTGTVGDMLWARPALTVLSIETPFVDGRCRRSRPRPGPGSASGSPRESRPGRRKLRLSLISRRSCRGMRASRSRPRAAAIRSKVRPRARRSMR
jgi:acetylornithine deacetylase/succinyl-diaminopimelate desuccinylase-like protein